MIARNLINKDIPPLKITDSYGKALMWMNTFHLQQLPVVKGAHLVGMVFENMLLNNSLSPGTTLKNYPFENTPTQVTQGAHIYEVLKIMYEHNLSSIAVANEEGKYMGLITLHTLLEYFGKLNAAQEPGGIIILEMPEYDYSLAEIARIVEVNNARILSMYLNTQPTSDNIEVTLKINVTDLNPIIATFERYKYRIIASFHENDYVEDMQERLDALMNYLSI